MLTSLLTLFKYLPLNISGKQFNRGKHLFILLVTHIPTFIIMDIVYITTCIIIHAHAHTLNFANRSRGLAFHRYYIQIWM